MDAGRPKVDENLRSPNVARKSSNNKIPCGLARKNSGVRVDILRGEALFFLDFLWLLSLIKQRK
jgi:hypothetical protein